jgi:SAM-dependent methyltransferase
MSIKRQLQYTLDSFGARLERQFFTDKGEGKLKGAYAYIPFSNEAFVDAALRARWVMWQLHQRFPNLYPERPRFLDIGSGIGSKVWLAERVGFYACGLEYDTDYIATAKKLYNIDTIQGDARTYSDYSDFDVLYYYCPMHDRDMQLELQTAALHGARPGTLFLQVLKIRDSSETGLTRINNDCINVAIKSQHAGIIATATEAWNNPQTIW